MTLPVRMGITLPVPPDVDASLRTAEWAEAQGYDGVWLADVGEIDSLTLAAAIALRTRRVRIGTAIIPVYTRTPVVLASTAYTLAQLAPGRFILGLGASSHLMIEGWHGLKLERPLTRVKETALIVRQALTGEPTRFEGATLRSTGYKLSQAAAVPIHLAALRAKMLELAGEIGDGVVVNLFPARILPRLLEHIAAGAARSGRKLEELEIVCRHQICVTANPAAARDLFRRRFAPYFSTPVYNKFLAWSGHEDAARAIAEGWRAKDRNATQAALTDEIVDQIAIIGDEAHCHARLRELIRGGITTPIVACFSPDPAEFRATYDAFVPARFPVSRPLPPAP
jgi:probable F420-dependent oxidoreductase